MKIYDAPRVVDRAALRPLRMEPAPFGGHKPRATLPENTLPVAERQRLVMSVSRYAWKLAHRMAADDAHQCRFSAADEFYSVAMTGACRAAQVWQPSRGVKFITYAVGWMRSAFHEHFRCELPKGYRRQGRTGCAEPDERPGIAHFHDPIRTGGHGPVSHSKDDKPGVFGDLLSAPEREDLDGWDDADWRWLLRRLPKGRAKAIKLYFREGLTYKECALKMGITGERVRQYVAGVLPLLRKRLERFDLTDKRLVA